MMCTDLGQGKPRKTSCYSQVIQSALFIPSWRSLNHLKGSHNHHKKGTKNCQEYIISFSWIEAADSENSNGAGQPQRALREHLPQGCYVSTATRLEKAFFRVGKEEFFHSKNESAPWTDSDICDLKKTTLYRNFKHLEFKNPLCFESQPKTATILPCDPPPNQVPALSPRSCQVGGQVPEVHVCHV